MIQSNYTAYNYSSVCLDWSRNNNSQAIKSYLLRPGFNFSFSTSVDYQSSLLTLAYQQGSFNLEETKLVGWLTSSPSSANLTNNSTSNSTASTLMYTYHLSLEVHISQCDIYNTTDPYFLTVGLLDGSEMQVMWDVVVLGCVPLNVTFSIPLAYNPTVNSSSSSAAESSSDFESSGNEDSKSLAHGLGYIVFLQDGSQSVTLSVATESYQPVVYSPAPGEPFEINKTDIILICFMIFGIAIILVIFFLVMAYSYTVKDKEVGDPVPHCASMFKRYCWRFHEYLNKDQGQDARKNAFAGKHTL